MNLLVIAVDIAIAALFYVIFFRPCLTLRILGWILRHTVVRLRVEGVENIPESGPVLLVANHVSLIDLLLIQSLSKRPVKFMVRAEVLDFVPTRFLFWYLGVLRVPSIRRPKAMRHFFEEARQRLAAGGILCMFPEGGSPETED